MKRTLPLIAVLALLFIGCASLEQNAYRTIGSISIAVDASMNTWGDYVRTGKADPNSEDKVRGFYEGYQASMRVARDAVTAYLRDPKPTDNTQLTMAMDNLNLSVAQLNRQLLTSLPSTEASKLRIK